MLMHTAPSSDNFVLMNATVPAVVAPALNHLPAKQGLVRADITVRNGIIERFGSAPADLELVDLRGGMVWPGFVDMHTHIDKGHIWPRTPNPDGSFMGALEAVRFDREAFWKTPDVTRRMEFSLKCAFAHGTRLLRTHIDVVNPKIGWH